MPKTSSHHAHGHRERAKKKFIDNDKRRIKLADYEIVELLLMHSIPRNDTKPIAKNLLKTFKSIKSIYNASDKERLSISYVGASTNHLLNVQHEFIRRIFSSKPHRSTIEASPSIPEPILNPAQEAYSEIIQHEEKGYWIMSLSAQGKTIALNKVEGIIDIDKPFADLRPFVKIALESNASAIFLCSNRPDNDKEIKHEDISELQKLSDLLANLSIQLRDHFIILENLIIFIKSQYIFTVENEEHSLNTKEYHAKIFNKDELKTAIHKSSIDELENFDDSDIFAYLLDRAGFGTDTQDILDILLANSKDLKNIFSLKFSKIVSLLEKRSKNALLSEKIYFFLALYREIILRYGLSDYLLTPEKARLPLHDINIFAEMSHLQLAHCETEEIWIAHLNDNKKLLSFEAIRTQDRSTISVNIGDIVAQALAKKTNAIIICHNHPGGNAKASTKDKESTAHIEKVLAQIHVSLAEHIIISENSCYLMYNGIHLSF